MNTSGDGQLKAFRQQLAASGCDYVLIADDPSRHCAEVRFLGPFLGKEVLWNACLLALCGATGAMAGRKQFIEVTPRDAFNYDLTVGLAVPEIDKSAILKAMIMIRKYKRLHIGYHEFGPEPQ